MPDTGWLLVGTGASGGTGDGPWSVPERITAADVSEAQYNFEFGPDSEELRGTNISASIPAGNTPVGVEVRIRARDTNGAIATVSEVGLFNGTPIGTAKTPGTTLVTNTLTDHDYGGAADDWGTSLSEALVEGSGFGAYVKVNDGGNGAGLGRVDAMWIKIHYATAATPVESDRSFGYAINATVTSDREIEYAINELGVVLSEREILYEVESNIIPPTVYAPPRPVQPEFSLAFYTPVGSGLTRRRTDLVSIDTQRTALSFTTQLEGFGQLNVGLDARHEPGSHLRYMYPAELPVDLPPFADVQLTDGGSGSVLFEGRLEEFSQLGGVIRAITATGYGLTATRDGYLADDDDTLTTNGEILRRALQAIPALRVSGEVAYHDPQIATSYRTLGPLMTADLVSQVMSTGDGFGRQVDFSVWEGRVVELMGRSRPHLPHYRIDEDETVQVAISYANVYSAVNVAFQTQTSGEASITAGSTSVTVTHGLQVTPREDQVTVNVTSGEPRVSGNATITSGNTSVTVNHGLSVTPELSQLTVASTNDLGTSAKHWWIENVTSTSFDIVVDADPGALGATFDWSIPTTWAVENITATTFDITVDATANNAAADFEYTVNIDNATTGEASKVLTDIPRRAILIPGGTLNYDLALGYRHAMLDLLSQPEYRVTINRHVSHWMEGPRGEPIPPWLVRAGQWIQVGDLPMQIILRTSYDVTGETYSIEAGAPSRDLGTLLSSMQRTVERLAAARNANTGGRL